MAQSVKLNQSKHDECHLIHLIDVYPTDACRSVVEIENCLNSYERDYDKITLEIRHALMRNETLMQEQDLMKYWWQLVTPNDEISPEEVDENLKYCFSKWYEFLPFHRLLDIISWGNLSMTAFIAWMNKQHDLVHQKAEAWQIHEQIRSVKHQIEEMNGANLAISTCSVRDMDS